MDAFGQVRGSPGGSRAIGGCDAEFFFGAGGPFDGECVGRVFFIGDHAHEFDGFIAPEEWEFFVGGGVEAWRCDFGCWVGIGCGGEGDVCGCDTVGWVANDEGDFCEFHSGGDGAFVDAVFIEGCPIAEDIRTQLPASFEFSLVVVWVCTRTTEQHFGRFFDLCAIFMGCDVGFGRCIEHLHPRVRFTPHQSKHTQYKNTSHHGLPAQEHPHIIGEVKRCLNPLFSLVGRPLIAVTLADSACASGGMQSTNAVHAFSGWGEPWGCRRNYRIGWV